MITTPMMRQYQEAKKACPDALLLFRMGDFYELFFEDARKAASMLGLALTSRDKGDNPVPMAGFPHHQLESYLRKLIGMGQRVAVCEQVEDPRLAKGLVKREVTRVVTPGTITDDALLDPRQCNFLAAVWPPARRGPDKSDPLGEQRVGLAWVELSTGKFLAAVVPVRRLADELARIQPAECLLPEGVFEPTSAVSSPANSSIASAVPKGTTITRRPDWVFGQTTAHETLTKQFGTAHLEGFGFGPDEAPALAAAGAAMHYLQETQKSRLDHIDRLLPYRPGQSLDLDESTRRSLEITQTLRDGRREGSLLAVIDRTVTPMGSRLLFDWIANPLTDIPEIEARYDAVEELLDDAPLCEHVREKLDDVYDLQRLLARITTGRATPRDLAHVGRTLRILPALKARLTARKSALLNSVESQLDLCPELRSRLESALADDCPLSAHDGGLIRPGYEAKLDALRELASGGKQWIASYQSREAERTAIASLKVGYNKIFGYYIEITNAHREKVPPEYIRKQTVKNAERYITPELKEYEERVVSADEKAKELEYELFLQLRQAVADAALRLQSAAGALAQLDVLVALAALARQRNYCRPELCSESVLAIRDGRHPVLDILEPDGTFVPNDAASDEASFILLITGPNMAGKSTYIRQVALIVLLAQAGSFVPARSAKIGIADRIFARVGASDELARGQSTFMVEMTETARILHNATPQSLVVLDEIGRGTSTYDGMSLAWSVIEHLHERLRCRTLFATHYHELTDLSRTLGGIKNLNVSVREWQEEVVFLHKIVDGPADKSYGIHVARLAGVPREVVERAKDVLARLEQEHVDANGRPRAAGKPKRQGPVQLALFEPPEHPLLDNIRQADLDGMSPQEALEQLKAWQEELSRQAREKDK
ncbi:MAG: DNA mismatch repair protein MutS [Planctomycetia bacterium]|nr:DNA mismatch repair protein MutS [Planctomycetia bacterium]